MSRRERGAGVGCPEKNKMLKIILFTPLILMIIPTETPEKMSASYLTPYYQPKLGLIYKENCSRFGINFVLTMQISIKFVYR